MICNAVGEPMSFSAYVEAMNRVQERLRVVTAALNEAGVSYAVIGGNAVATWIARRDPSATRTTKDVDLLVRKIDVELVSAAMAGIGFIREDLRGWVIFLDPQEPQRRAGVHLVWAGQKVWPSNTVPAPDVDESVFDADGFWVLDLPALVRMKLTSFRDLDRVHVADMLRVGLIDSRVRDSLPEDLRVRLDQVEQAAREAGLPGLE
ncbi:MAG: hypothetical protein IT449_17005 [Phycisphaerales bacterium]|nr:hypothetical protein [Phycisphaerales bacterium]